MHRRTFRTAVAVAAAVTLSAGLAACGPADPDQPTSLGIGVGPGLFGGQYNPTTVFGMDRTAVYESLLSYNVATSEFEPLLATSFELSDDRKTITLSLRDDVDFTDGEHFDAAAAVEIMTALIEKNTENATWRFPDHDVQITATGDYELEITLAIPTTLRPGDILLDLTNLPIFSPAYVDDFEALATAPVGTGPYVLEEVVPEVSATFTLNEDYWNEDIDLFDNLELVAYDDEVAALNALKSGQVDAVKVSTAIVEEAEANGFTIVEGIVEAVGLWIADRGGSIQPALADVRVREAIQYAFDRETINESLNRGFGVITSQPFAVGTPEYVEGGDDRYDYDPEKARSLMEEAGYADGFDITIPTTPFLGVSTWEPIVTQYLGDIGIRATYDFFADTGAYFTAALSGTYPVLLYPGQAQSSLDVYFLPTAVFAFPGADPDPTIAALTDTMTNGNLEESLQAQSDIGEYVLDEAWYTVFVAPNILWATSPEVEIVGGLEHLALISQFRRAG
jgi:peptide/nickel transport system substrate-binding protein